MEGMKKRYFLRTGAAIVGAAALFRFWPSQATDSADSTGLNEQMASEPKGADADGEFEVTKTVAEWRKVLTPEEFAVLREHHTERPHSSPLNKLSAVGTYVCAGCRQPLYSSEAKFDSGTGWPSFYAALDNAVGTSVDKSFLMTRTEVHCDRCGGHLGHIFDDGPAPTGKRHCINGVALKFVAA